MASQLERCVPTLRVRDASAAARYFYEQLGFAKDWEHRFEPGLPLFVSVSRDGVALHLSEHTGDGPLEVRVYVYVHDPRALFNELKSRGARIVTEPELQSYGTLEFIVEDLDGNRIRFGKAVSTSCGPPPNKALQLPGPRLGVPKVVASEASNSGALAAVGGGPRS